MQTLPLLDGLRKTFPHATIGWAIQKSFAPLLIGHPKIDHLHILGAKKLGPCFALGRELRDAHYDIVLDAQGLFVSGVLSRLSNAPRRVGYNWRREANQLFMTDTSVEATDRVHMVEKILRLGDAIGAKRYSFERDEFLATRPLARTIESGRSGTVALVVGASVASKTLSAEHWARLAKELLDNGFTPVLIGGPQERLVSERIVTMIEHPVVNLVGQTTFAELASHLARTSVVVSSDTGAMHLAVAVGTPTVGLFGVTDPVRTGNTWGAAPHVVLDAGGNAESRNFRDVSPDMQVVDTIPTQDILSAVHRIARGTS